MAVRTRYHLANALWRPIPDGVPIPGGGNQDPPPPPPTSRPGMLVGASAGDGSASSQTAFKSAAATAGPWPIVRVYQSSSFKDTWAQDVGAWTDGHYACAYSCKSSLDLLVSSATERARLAGFVRSIPDSSEVWLEDWHELGVKQRKNIAPFTTLTLAQINAGKQIFYDIVKQAAKPHLHTYLCCTDFDLNGGVTVGTPDEFWVGGTGSSRLIDAVTYDAYRTSDGSYNVATKMAPCVAFANNKGAAWGLTETGIHDGVTDYAAAATWMHNMADYAATHGAGPHSSAAMLIWFNSNNATALPVPTQDPALMAASASIGASYYTPYTTFAL
jgi:hypothetical protein